MLAFGIGYQLSSDALTGLHEGSKTLMISITTLRSIEMSIPISVQLMDTRSSLIRSAGVQRRFISFNTLDIVTGLLCAAIL